MVELFRREGAYSALREEVADHVQLGSNKRAAGGGEGNGGELHDGGLCVVVVVVREKR